MHDSIESAKLGNALNYEIDNSESQLQQSGLRKLESSQKRSVQTAQNIVNK